MKWIGRSSVPALALLAAAMFCLLAFSVAAHAASPSSLTPPSPQATPTTFAYIQLTASYSVIGGGDVSPPVLNYVHQNSTVHVPLTTFPQKFAADVASQWSITLTAGNNTATQRWYTDSTLSGILFGTTTVNVVYYHQYSLSFGFDVAGGSGGGSPAVTYRSGGAPATSSVPQTVWADAGSNFTYSQLTSGSNLDQRWILDSPGSGSVSGATSFSATYLHQDSFVLAYSVHGGNLSAVPILNGTSLGTPTTTLLGGTPSVTWLDAGTRFSITNPLPPSDSQLRWFAAGRTSGVASTPENFTLAYFRQESFTAYYTMVNGSAPSPPVIETTSFGSLSPQYITTTPAVFWSDVGSQYSVPGTLVGSSPTERWVTPDNATGSVTPGLVLHVTYYHQYLLSLQYVQPQVAGFVPPALEADSFGSLQNVTLAGNGASLWVDNGTSLVAASPSGQGHGERWGVAGSVPKVIDGPVNASVSFVYQYAFDLSYSVSGGGNPLPPMLQATSSGRPMAANLTAQGSTFWLDSGTPWSVQGTLQGPSSGGRWAASHPYGGDVSSPTTIDAQYVLQYYVKVGAPGVGGNSSASSGWYNAGSSLKLSFTPSPGWIFSGWRGNGTGSYSGSEASPVVNVSGTMQETPLVDATLQIYTTQGGTVSYVSGDSGLQRARGNSVIPVAPGSNVTLVAKPSSLIYSFSRWSGAVPSSGPRVGITVNGLTRMTAEFSLNYLAIGALVVLAGVVAALGISFWRARRRWMPGVRSLIRVARGVRKVKR